MARRGWVGILGLSLLLSGLLFAPPAARAADEGDDDLGPSTAVPWNPEQPVARQEPWEAALRLPGRIVSLPFSVLGAALRSGLYYVEDASIVPKLYYVVALQEKVGLYALPASLGPRTGFGGMLQFKPTFLKGHLLGELSGSTAGYNAARVEVSYGVARLAYTSQWRPRDQFFGIGRTSGVNDDSEYALRDQVVRGSIARTWGGRPMGTPETAISAWLGPRDVVMRNGRSKADENVNIRMRFPALSNAILDTHVEHLVYGVRASHDRRHGIPHWAHGWRAAVEVERFDKSIESLALRAADTPATQFTRITYEAEGAVSWRDDPRTLRLALKAVDQKLADGSGVFLISDLARLGGSDGLTGFEPGRFHDVDMMVAKLSYIFPLTKNLEFDIHAETGGVFARLGDAQAGRMKNSYGVSLRPRLETAPLGSIGVDWSSESVRFRFSFGDVE